MRVLLLSRFFMSGQTTHVVSLAKALARIEAFPHVLVVGAGHPNAVEIYGRDLNEHGIPCTYVPSAKTLQAVAQSLEFDLIHCHSSDLIPAALHLRDVRGHPLVVTCHGFGVPRLQPQLAKADALIAVGPRVLQELQAHGLRGAALIGNGVDVDHFRPGVKRAEFQIAYVGRIDATKRLGLQELVCAVGGIPRARLVVAANDRPNAPWCTSTGWQEDVGPLLAESHVVCGTGRAVREGMAAGCVGVVIGARYGGVVTPSFVMGAEDGFPSFSGLQGPAPNRSILRVDLIRLLQDREHCRRLARWSRRYACRHFSIVDAAKQTLQLYRQAVSRCVRP